MPVGIVLYLSKELYGKLWTEVGGMDLQAWWNSLDALMRVLYAIAIPASCALMIQIVLIAIGLGHGGAPDALGSHLGGPDHFDFLPGGAHHGVDLTGMDAAGHDFTSAHPDADGMHPAPDSGMSELRLFSISGIVSFFTVFGWSAIILYSNGLYAALAVGGGFALGYGAMFGVAKMVQWSMRLAEDGNLNLDNALGKTATVYIPIPAPGGGEGKVTLTLQGQFVELSAVTEKGEVIPSGALVRVTDLKEGVLVVERTGAGQA